MDKHIRPLMLGDCSCCIHKEICRYEGVASYIKYKFEECTVSHNPFKLTCENFECDKFR
jgi:hypothetical protein